MRRKRPRHWKKTEMRIEQVFSYDLEFYKFKNGRINVAKMVRCTGLSRDTLNRELYIRGLLR